MWCRGRVQELQGEKMSSFGTIKRQVSKKKKKKNETEGAFNFSA